MTGKEPAQRRGEHRAGIIFCVSAVFFCAILLLAGSCGIEVYYALDPPSERSLANPTDPGGRYFSFYTRETGDNNSQSVFFGTNIFYKIYNNQNELRSEYESINGANSEYSVNGYNRMASLDYRQLQTASYPNILFTPTSNNREVRVRLIDEGRNAQGTYDFPAQILLAGADHGKAVRRPSSEGFNFYIDPNPDNCDKLPAAGDWDVRMSSSPETDTWYVNAYAVSVGQDTNLTPLYSQLLWLGYIQIKKP